MTIRDCDIKYLKVINLLTDNVKLTYYQKEKLDKLVYKLYHYLKYLERKNGKEDFEDYEKS